MTSLFDEDDREETRSDADLTLGIGSLLSIFFGVVLICGIFFGFGYSMGRRNAHPVTVAATAPAQNAGSSSPLPENELNPPPLKPQSPDDADSDSTPAASDAAHTPATHAEAPAEKPAPKESKQEPKPDSAPAKPTRAVEPAASDTSLNAVPFTHRAALPTKPHAGISAPLAQAPGDAPIVPGQPIMVQIAAVSRQEDAQVLAGALRKRGFNPTVHPGGADKFFHVQVGPFTDKTQAEAMKQRLLADGYNAILK